MSAKFDATWQLIELGDETKPLTTLSITFITDSLAISYEICKTAAAIATTYGMGNEITLHADPIRSFITLHLYEKGNLTDAHFAMAQEISSVVATRF